jgi:guanosine-3',5'-bis(diphosphate) 3'-pyrophosphohydrolase
VKPGLYNEEIIQKAIQYLFSKLEDSKNPKPFALHSIRSATILWSNNAPQDAVVACVLHDLIEDTDTTIEEIEIKFGNQVASIVDACTFDFGSKDYKNKLIEAKKSIDKALDNGKEALLVKAADFIDNSNYYKLSDKVELDSYLYDKFKYFMQIAEEILKDEPIWSDVQEAYDHNVAPLMS